MRGKLFLLCCRGGEENDDFPCLRAACVFFCVRGDCLLFIEGDLIFPLPPAGFLTEEKEEEEEEEEEEKEEEEEEGFFVLFFLFFT